MIAAPYDPKAARFLAWATQNGIMAFPRGNQIVLASMSGTEVKQEIQEIAVNSIVTCGPEVIRLLTLEPDLVLH